MVTEIVADSSIIVALVIPEELSEWAFKKTDQYEFLHIPEFAYYEVANALKNKTPKQLPTKEAEKLFSKAIGLMDQFGIHSFGEIVIDALSLALELNIAVYDAAFVCLAETLGLQLLTLDIKLAKRLENTKYSCLIEYPNKP
jgi:predicted nucleic acid-binding protein